MRDSPSDRPTVARGVVGASGNGRVFGLTDPLDRGYLLRRGSRFPFPDILTDSELVRLRRERRVSASFTAIRPLSRHERG